MVFLLGGLSVVFVPTNLYYHRPKSIIFIFSVLIVRFYNKYKTGKMKQMIAHLVAIIMLLESKMFLIPTRTENSVLYVIPAYTVINICTHSVILPKNCA